MTPITKNFDSFLEIFKQVPMLPQVFTFERIREIITWKDNRKSGEVLTLTEGEQTILKKFGYEVILESEREMSRLVYEEIDRNIINDIPEAQLKKYLALLNEKVSYRIQRLEQYNYIDVLYDPALSHVSPRLFYDYLQALRTTFCVFQSIEEYLIAKQREYGFLTSFKESAIQVSEEEYIPHKSDLTLKSQFVDPDKYDEIMSKLINNGNLRKDGERNLIFVPMSRKNAQYEAVTLFEALKSLGFFKKSNYTYDEMRSILSNTFKDWTLSVRTISDKKTLGRLSEYEAIIS